MVYFDLLSILSHYASARRVSHEEQRVEEALRLGMARDWLLVSGACVCCRLGRSVTFIWYVGSFCTVRPHSSWRDFTLGSASSFRVCCSDIEISRIGS